MSEKQAGLPKFHHSSTDLSSAASSEFEEAASSGAATTSGQDTGVAHQQAVRSDSHKADFDPFKDLESAAHKAAEMASEAAKEVSSKLFGGGSLTRLADDVSSWWAALDPSPRPATSTAGAPASQSTSQASQATTEVQQRFGLPDTEELVEQMPCTLVQAGQCSHNGFTPYLPVRFNGVLYITTQHVCFHSPAEKLSFAIQLERSSKVQKTLSPKKVTFTMTTDAGEEPALQLGLGQSKHVTFEGFQGSGLDDALGLIEHLAQELH
ncbi:hypothetical protein WJX73_006783 [Symbiochloris irregularis]|uniref:GRAM domain-containing protein n=1 Tax=Symbiochloris irregularis TaxID=706552 RepID=A0AAW1PHN9_9CHLO